MYPCYNEATAKGCSTLLKDVMLCKKSGFTCIEPRIDMLCGYLENHSMEKLFQLISESGLKVYTINAVYLYRDFLTDKDTQDRASRLFSEFTFACQVARMLHAPGIILVPPMNKEDSAVPFGMSEREVEDMIVPMLRILSDLAAGYSLSVALEPVGAERCSVRTISQAKRILDLVGRTNCKLVIDAFNLFLFDPDTDFNEICQLNKDDILIVHINDCEKAAVMPYKQCMRTFAGTGVVNLEAFLKNLSTIGYEGPVSVETFRPEYWTMEAEKVIEDSFKTTSETMRSVLNGGDMI